MIFPSPGLTNPYRLDMISRNLSQRIMTGLPLAAVAIWYIFGASESLFIAITVLIGIIGYYEAGRALKFKKVEISLFVLYASLIVVFVGFWFYLQGDQGKVIGACGLLCCLMIVGSLRKQQRQQKTFVWYLVLAIWILGPLCLLYILRFKLVSDRGSELIFFIILVAAFNDIFAFFGGKRFGKHPLAKVISPKKTIEGSVFGIVGGLLAGLIMAWFWLFDLLHIWQWTVVILVMVIASQAGDLVESKFKRFCGIKDSSNLIPGHGGLLDRIDAYLLALPTFIGLLYSFGVV